MSFRKRIETVEHALQPREGRHVFITFDGGETYRELTASPRFDDARLTRVELDGVRSLLEGIGDTEVVVINVVYDETPHRGAE